MTDHSLQADAAVINPQATQPRSVYRVEQFMLDDGNIIFGRQLVSADVMNFNPVQYFAPLQVMVRTPGGPQPLPIEIPIDGANPIEAAANMESNIKDRMQAVTKAKLTDLAKQAEAAQLRAALLQGGRVQLPPTH